MLEPKHESNQTNTNAIDSSFKFIVNYLLPHSVYEYCLLNPVGMGLGRTNRTLGAFGSVHLSPVHLLRSSCPQTISALTHFFEINQNGFKQAHRGRVTRVRMRNLQS